MSLFQTGEDARRSIDRSGLHAPFSIQRKGRPPGRPWL